MPDIEYVTKELHDESIRRIDDENDRQNAHIKPSKYDGLRGQRFGRLIVASDPIKKRGFRYYVCHCDCGKEKTIRADGLVSGFVVSCGCFNKEILSVPREDLRHKNEYYIVDNVAHVRLTNCDDEMLCDAEDWERLKDHCWMIGSDGYARTNKHQSGDNLRSNKFHKNIVTDGDCVDHINRNRLDNRRCNLRAASLQLNTLNRGLNKNNTTGRKGVYHRSDNGRWKATIFVNGKEHSLGNYATKEEAVIAREKGEKIYHNPILEGAT